MKTVIYFLCLIALVTSQTTSVSQCIYQAGSLPINTYIENCENPPCQFPQLTDAVINVIFRAPHTIRSMRTLAHAYILGPIGISHDLGDEAITCNFLTNTNCPLMSGEVVQYTLRMHIESYFPAGTSVTIEFRIVDENNLPVMCLRVPVTIISPISRAMQLNGLQHNSTVIVH